MDTRGLIAISDFCMYHHVEYTFIGLLHEAGLIELNVVDKKPFIPEPELNKLEKIVRLNQELDINLEGIEAIVHLLQRVEAMQEELRQTKNRLKIYED